MPLLTDYGQAYILLPIQKRTGNFFSFPTSVTCLQSVNKQELVAMDDAEPEQILTKKKQWHK